MPTPTTTSTTMNRSTPTTTPTSTPTPTTMNRSTPTTTIAQNTSNHNYSDYNIGMMLKGSNNTGNLNDFLAKNTLLGNNLYISPMNQSGFVGDDYEDNIFNKTKKNKIIDSTFTPMIHLL